MTGDIPLATVWYATGNNVALGADSARRILYVRLKSPDEVPEERSKFIHRDLLGWVLENRGRLVMAALTILPGYVVAVSPDMNLKVWGSFTGWSDLVRNAIVWAGQPDPGLTRQEVMSQADRQTSTLRLLLAGLDQADPKGEGLTASQILEIVANALDKHATLWDAIGELTRSGKAPTSQSIGMRFHHLRERVVDGRCLQKRDRSGATVWYVAKAGD